jgi:translation initiation factor IF-3
MKKGNKNKPKVNEPLMNGKIVNRYQTIRIVGSELLDGIVNARKALEVAEENGLDLVLVNDKNKPAICKILDYKKYLFDQKKKAKAAKAQKSNEVIKEINLGSINVDDNDLNHRAKKTLEFLSKGNKVKVYFRLKGRVFYSKILKAQGIHVMNRFLDICNELNEYEDKVLYYSTPAKINGRLWEGYISFKKKKK